MSIPAQLIVLIQENKAQALEYVLNQLPHDTIATYIDTHQLLFHSVLSGSIGCVRVLMSKGANVDMVSDFNDYYKTTALNRSCRLYHMTADHTRKVIYIQLIRFFIESGADCNSSNDIGWTPLMYICHFISGITSDYDIQERKGIIQMLISHGANRDLVDNEGHTAEQLARPLCGEIADTVRDCQPDVPDTKGVYV